MSRPKLAPADWAIRSAIALVFIVFGSEKFSDQGWIKLFAQIGLGQWFRYFTGSLQITGSILLLIPRLARMGTALLASTMIGAIIVHLFVLGTGIGAAIVPAALLGLILFAGWKRRGQPEETGTSLSLR